MKLNKLQYICAILMCYTSTQMFAQQYSGHNSSNLTSVEWTLDECINYALEHNADIAMGELDVESGKIALNSARMARLPYLSASLGGNIYFGRSPSRDATYIDNSQISGSLEIATNIPVYQGFKIKHETDKSKLDFEAATQNLAQARKNISLKITSLFLQVMYDKELVCIAQSQLELSSSQLELYKGQYESGKISRNNVVRSESLVAADRASLIQNENTYALDLLVLKHAMNLPDSVSLLPIMNLCDIPIIEEIPSLNQVFEQSVRLHPAIKYAEASLKSSEFALKSAKSSYHPTVFFSAGYNNSIYSNLTKRINTSFWNQIKSNGNEYIGLSIYIPVFSRNTIKNNVRLSKLSVKRQEILLFEAQKCLKKEIEQAYYEAISAQSSLISAKKAFEASILNLENEKVNLNLGHSNIYDYANAMAEVKKAQAFLAHSKYDLILRIKILNFYMN